MKAQSFTFLILPLLAIVLVSGCTGLDPEALAKSNSMIQQFLNEHPNAQIKVTHFTAEQAKNIIDQVRSDCDNPYIDEKEFYRVNVTDPGTNFFATIWIDWGTKTVECVYKIGTEGKVLEKPKPAEGCESHSYVQCSSGHLYWFDSCGNKQEKKEYCRYGCSDSKCLGECKSQAEYRCYGDNVYWFDSCGNKQEKKEYCQFGCENGFCKSKASEKTCEEAGGYCVWPQGYCGDGICTESESKQICSTSCSGSSCSQYTYSTCPEGCMAECVPSECSEDGEICTADCEGPGSCVGEDASNSPCAKTCKPACLQDCGLVTIQSSTSSASGGQAPQTGMIVSSETSATKTRVSYQCKQGYQMAKYFCNNGGICCVPRPGIPEPPSSGFCGKSTYGSCESDDDCITGGCSGQICQSVFEESVASTCEYRDCYNPDNYGLECKCAMAADATIDMEDSGMCQWAKTGSSTCGNGICESGEAEFLPTLYE